MSTADFAGFYASQWSDVAGYCSALTGSRELGEELAQESFVRLYARWGVIQEPRPYLFRIASNLVKTHGRKSKREVPTETVPEQIAEAMGVDIGVYDAVQRLPERLRAVVLLHYYADLSVEAVGAALRRPTGTIKRQLSEARAVLAESLGEHR